MSKFRLFYGAALLVFLLAMNSAASAQTIQTSFTYKPDAAAKLQSVNLVGEFNGWNTTAMPMQEKDGEYKITIPLSPGLHAYKFLLNGTDWINDPSADAKLDQPDGNGGKNSGIQVGGARHQVEVEHLFEYTPTIPVDQLKNVTLVGDFNGWNTTATPMTAKNGTFTAMVKLAPGLHQYKFLLNDHDWVNDPKADPKLDQPDGNGGKNSAVQIDKPARDHAEAPLPPADDKTIVLADGSKQYQHEFFFRPNSDQPDPNSVAVAGDFNGWNTSANVMSYTGGAFRASLPLTEGVHSYKLVIDGKWSADPRSDTALELDDGYGGKNSALLAGPDGRSLPTTQPNAINRTAVLHDPQDLRDCDVVDSSHVRLSIRCQADDVQTVNVLWSGSDGNWSQAPLYKTQSSVGIDRYSTLLTTPAGQPVHYVFELIDGTTTTYLAASADATTLKLAQASPFTTTMQPLFETPAWAQHAVWYQIFPDRFRNGDPSNDPPNTVKWTSDWWSKLPGETGELYHDIWKRRYGGDFQGITQQLPYLRSLGITAIYLNPIFKAEDVHKYDTSASRATSPNCRAKPMTPQPGNGRRPTSCF